MSGYSLLGFNGAYLDSTTGCYPLGSGYRWDMTGLMRLNASDSYSPFGEGGINPYVYCADDPINRSDPSGHVSFSSFLDVGLMFPGVGEGEIPELTSRVHILDENNRVVPMRSSVSSAHEETLRPRENDPSPGHSRTMNVWSVPDSRNFQHDMEVRKIRGFLGIAEISIDRAASISKSLLKQEQSLDDIHRMFLQNDNVQSLGSGDADRIFGGGGSQEIWNKLRINFYTATDNMRDAGQALYYANKALSKSGLDQNSEEAQLIRLQAETLNNRLETLNSSFISFDQLHDLYRRLGKGWFFSQETSL